MSGAKAKQKPRVGHDRMDFSRRGSASLTSSHFKFIRICGDSSWCMRFDMRTLGRTSRKLLRRIVCIFFDHFGQRPKTKARQMLRRLERTTCAHRPSPTRNHAQSGRDCQHSGCSKADPKHIRFIKLERIGINVWRASRRACRYAQISSMSAIGTKRTVACAPHMSALDPKRT